MAYPSISTTFTGPGNQGVQVGHNSGSIHVALAERPETPPQPSCFVPFRRDTDFVDRGTLLHQIREKCAAPASRVALVGLGGVGKSQLAIEYCYRVAEQSPETWVFWAHASNTARLEQSYREIADHLKIRGRKDPQADAFKLVHDWLRNEKNGPWLLVLDNADDATVLSPPSGNRQEPQADGDRNVSRGALRQHLPRYLPPSKHGSVIITSRTNHAAMQLVELDDIISIEVMHDTAAHALLRKKLGGVVDKDDGINELATALEYMPLALVQAAAFIRKRAPRCSVRQYLEEYHQSDRRKTSLLNHEAGNLRRDETASNSILLTWQISFNYLRSTRPSAADLLSVMSFFDRQGIHETLLHKQDDTQNQRKASSDDKKNDQDKTWNNEKVSNNVDSDSTVNVDDGFEDDVLMLRDYSFITVIRNTNTFEMHNLVQLAMRKWLENQGQFDKWRDKFISNLCAEIPTGQYENWEKCQALFPHAKAAASHRPTDEEALKKWAKLLFNAAWYAWQRGRAGDAEYMSTLSMKARGDVLGMENSETMSSMAMVGLSRSLGGRFKDSEELGVQVLETYKRVLGDEHPNTLTSMANLASTYRNRGLWKEAEELEVQVVERMKKVLGEEHPNTLISMSNLASTYLNQGRWREAEKLDVQVMEIRKRVLGEDHPSMLGSIENLALTYRDQGRLGEAEELGMQVVERRTKVLGEEHISTLISTSNLAFTYRAQGRLGKAEELELQVVERMKRVLGEEHPNTLTSMGNLASTYITQSRWSEAEELGAKVFEISKRVLGDQHPSTLSSMSALALTYTYQQRWKEAESTGRQVIALREKVLGPEHLDTLNSVYCLAHLLATRRCYDESRVLYERACTAYSAILPEDHRTRRACRQHFSEMLASQERDQAFVVPKTPGRGLNTHAKKESKLTRALAKIGISSTKGSTK